MKHYFKELISPLVALKIRYIPILTIHLAIGFSSFSNIAETFWIKESLSLTVTELIAIGIWTSLPVSMKIFFGHFLDSVKIAGSSRYSYIWIGAILSLIGNLITIGFANKFQSILALGSPYQLMIISGTFVQVGAVLQFLATDALSYNIIKRFDHNNKPLPKETIELEIKNVQIITRIFDLIGSLCAVLISGIIAEKYGYTTISYFIPIVTLMSIAGTLVIRKEPQIVTQPFNKAIIIGGLVYISLMTIIAFSTAKYSQEIIFLIGMAIVCRALYPIMLEMERQRRKEIFCILVILFIYRIVPLYGLPISWWQIDVLKFTPEFLGTLAQIQFIMLLLGVWLLGQKVLKHPVALVIFWVNIFDSIFKLPYIAMAFGFHEWTMQNFGFGAQTITLIDSTCDGALYRLNMLILCTAAVVYAPKKYFASWFALVMSLMSLSFLVGRGILEKLLCNIYIVERGNYENIPALMIATSLIQFLLPTLTILIFMNPFKRSKDVSYASGRAMKCV